jgi:serine phosphatase RsbU (regulator of sigma subunit)
MEEVAYAQNIIYLGVIGFLILIGSLFYFMTSNRRKNRLNEILSEKNNVIQEQKNSVDVKNKSISDSINYARRLQTAILPTAEQINEFLPRSFLFFRPKDVVSGDFHWFEQKGDAIFLAVADCTGHGVPGALVSVVCSNALNRSVNEFGLIQPKDILDKTRDLVIDTFAKSGDKVNDGMDISLISINKKTKKVLFAGAHNSLWIIRDNDKIGDEVYDEKRTLKGDDRTLIEFKGDKQPIGIYSVMTEFTEVDIDLKDNDILYLFSDGFADQFGGEKGKKFKYGLFKRELLENSNMTMEDQKGKLIKTFEDWKGDHDQIDDVCVMGVRVFS